jgi:hypothetical protein
MGTSLTGLTPAATYQGLIKFGDNSAISATLRYLSDGLGNDLPISVASASVGINTTTGSALFNIKGTGASSSTSSLIVQNSAGTNSMQVLDNTNTILGKAIKIGTGGTITDTSGYMTMFNGGNSSWIGPETLYTNSSGYTINASGTIITLSYLLYGSINYNWLVGSGAPNTARLSVKGSGSTSATNTILAQNSSATQLFKLTDDGKVTLGTGTTGTALLDVAIGSGAGAGVRIKGYSDASTPYLISLGTESYQQGFFIKMVNGSTIMQNQFDGFDVSLKAFNGGIMVKNSGAIGIGTDTPNLSAKLQMDSTTQGFLPPRMTDAQVRAIATPAVGLTMYNTDLDCPVFYSTAGWRKISHSAM